MSSCFCSKSMLPEATRRDGRCSALAITLAPNGQVATDTRLWLYGALGVTRGYLADLIKAAVARAEADADVLMPGFTHLQPAQVGLVEGLGYFTLYSQNKCACLASSACSRGRWRCYRVYNIYSAYPCYLSCA